MIKRFCILIAFCVSLLSAEEYAVVVGANTSGLVGAVNDARTFARILHDYAGVPERNIILLDDDHASRNEVLAALQKSVQKIRKGDRFFFFFSGHGTSLKDVKFDLTWSSYGYRLLENSGGLIPYGFDPYDLNSALDTMLIGRRDLRPYFEMIDKKAEGVVFLDACFSGHTFKSSNKWVKKFAFDLSKLKRKMKQSNKKIQREIAEDAQEEVKTYPYDRFVAFTSSSSSEVSFEDPDKRRGVFSMALNRCFRGVADRNHDGKITKYELRNCIDVNMPNQKAMAYPEGVKGDETVLFTLKRNWVESLKLYDEAGLQTWGGNFVRTDKKEEAQIAVFETSPGRFKVIIDSGNVEYTKAGKLVDTLGKKELEKFARGYSLIRLLDSDKVNKVTLELSALDDDKVTKSSRNFEEGQKWQWEVRSSSKGYLFLLSLGPTGNLYALLPNNGYPVHVHRQTAGNFIVQGDISTVEAPFGTECMTAFVIYDEKLAHELMGSIPGAESVDGRMSPRQTEEMYKLLSAYPGGWQSQYVMFKTHASQKTQKEL